jgi:hypothetical protein
VAQQLVILSREESSGDGLATIGTRSEIVGSLVPFNTAPARDGDLLLYGPGIMIELPADDRVTQMLLTITEEEIAWQVIMRLGKAMGWKLLDPNTGRELCP